MKKLSITILVLTLLLSLPTLADSVTDNSSTVQPVQTITIEPNPDRYIEVWADFREILYEGESVQIYSRLVGFEEATSITYQWQINSGSGWQDISGATNDTYTVIVNSQSLKAEYRLMVTSVWGE